MIKTIILDFDGVIADSFEYHFKAYGKVFRDVGIEMEKEFFAANFGIGAEALIRAFLKKKNIEVSDWMVRKYVTDKDANVKVEHMFLNVGIEQLLKAIYLKYNVVVGSAGLNAPIKKFLKIRNISQFFKAIYSEEDVEKVKPDPEVFLKIAKDFGCDPSECLVLEDSPTGIIAAKNAGMPVIGVGTGPFDKEQLKDADIFIDNCKELKQITGFIKKYGRTVKLRSYAKVNLTLDVMKNRKDGYHDIRTTFQQVRIFDNVFLAPLRENKIRLRCNWDELNNNDNLAYKAAELVMKRMKVSKGVEITIYKRIPIGSGLAGGSSNAAAVIKGLNYLWNLKMSKKVMLEMASELGSDVAFNLIGGTCLGESRGEVITKLPDMDKKYLVIVSPDFEIGTGKAYDALKMSECGNKDSTTKFIKKYDLKFMHNDFEKTVFKKYPELKKMKNDLGKTALLSGSGSTIFAVFNTKEEADKKAKLFDNVIVAETINRSIKLADERGFCFGVTRALQEIRKVAKKETVYVLGNLIHNNQVIEKLVDEGIHMIEDYRHGVSKGIIAITAHGIADSVIENIKEKEFEVLDLTCPHVKKVHTITKQAEKEGRHVVVFGSKEHVEVKGIVGNLVDYSVIASAEDEIYPEGPITLVSQTTRDYRRYKEIAAKLKKQYKKVKVENTICEASIKRQESARDLAENSDLVIVIGGKMSSNTKRLCDICSKHCLARHIESRKEVTVADRMAENRKRRLRVKIEKY